MMEQLLRLVAEGGIHSYEDLAQHLLISQPLLEMMLEDLARLGYLRRVGDDCGERCLTCHSGGCVTMSPGQIWTLTSKGAQAAAHPGS
jgi:hypothetical protein